MRTRLSSNEHNSIATAMHIVALSAIARAKTCEEFPPRLRERAAYFGAQAGRCAAIKDLQRWLIGVNLADDLLRSMLDQTVKSIVEIADLIEKELNQPVPVASHRESSGNG